MLTSVFDLPLEIFISNMASDSVSAGSVYLRISRAAPIIYDVTAFCMALRTIVKVSDAQNTKGKDRLPYSICYQPDSASLLM